MIAQPVTRLWYCPENYSEEAAGSWLVRSSCLYGVRPDEMRAHLAADSDKCRALADLLSLKRRRADEADLGGYCPLCFVSDFRQGRVPHFRRSWIRVWSTHCNSHRTPLFMWPYRDGKKQIFFPEWVAQLHWRSRPMCMVRAENAEVVNHLRLVRALLHDARRRPGVVFSWAQQLQWEHNLLDDPAPSMAPILGIDAGALRGVVADLACLLGSTFGTSDRCLASRMALSLGPDWLFATSSFRGEGGMRALVSFSDPRQRRSLLTLVLRILMSFVASPDFNADGNVTAAGESPLSKTLSACPLQAKIWVDTRSTNWPSLVSLGVRKAIGLNG